MGKPVYVLVLVKGSTEAWYQLPADERQRLWAQALASRDQAGGKATLNCDSRWSSQQWMGFFVEEYPSVEALQEHMKRLSALNWWRFMEITTVLGTAWE